MLRQHPDVQDAVVMARDDVTGEKRLVAYMTANGDQPPAAGGLRDFLRAQTGPLHGAVGLCSARNFPAHAQWQSGPQCIAVAG